MVHQVAKPEGTLNYAYTNQGQLKKVWQSGAENQGLSQGSGATGWTVPAFPYYQYYYDDAGRLETVLTPSGQTKYDYYANGSRKNLTLPNQVTTTYTYDNLLRLDTMVHQDDESNLLASFDYDIGISGKRSSVVETISGTTVQIDYAYDGLDRLTASERDDGTSHDTTYTYDVVGNRLTKTIGSTETTYTYNPLDQLESETTSVETTNYGYDLRGNLSSKTANGETINYIYDSQNKLRKVYNGEIIQSNLQLEYAYDFAGNRFSKAEKEFGSTVKQTQFLIDKNNLTGYSQTLLEIDYTTGAIDKHYEYGDDLYCQVDDPSSFALQPSYFLYDGLGSTRALTDSSGAILVNQTYNYHPFGEGISHPQDPSTNHLFTGEYFDNDLDYYYLRARYYSPGIGRFTSHDPAEDANNKLHKYAYCGNDSINQVDPSGLFASLNYIGQVAVAIIVTIVAGIAIGAYKGKRDTKGLDGDQHDPLWMLSLCFGAISGAATAISIFWPAFATAVC